MADKGQTNGSKKPSEVKSDVEGRSKVTTFDELNDLAGAQGGVTIFILCLCAYGTFINPLQTINYQFLGATPDHWCHVPELTRANWSQEEVLSVAIPYSNQSGHASCQMYALNYSEVAVVGVDAAMGLAAALDAPVTSCSSRDFDTSQYQSTVVTEWDLVCERRVLYSTTQAVTQAGALLGSVLVGYCNDQFGRRPVALVSTILFTASGFLAAFSPSVEVYIFAKLFIALWASGVYLSCFVLVMELCSSRHRSTVSVMFVLPWALGYMALPGIAYLVRTWYWLQLALTAPALVTLSYFWLLPESPRWLVAQGRLEDALRTLKWLARINGRTLPPDEELRGILASLTVQKPSDDPDNLQSVGICRRILASLSRFFALLASPALRFRAIVVFFCWFAASLIYYGVALNATNLSADPYLYMFLGGLLEVPSYALLWPLIVYVGRKWSVVALLVVCGASILGVMGLMLSVVHGSSSWLVITLSLCGKLAITAAFHLLYIFTAELFPTKQRSLAVGQANACARIGSTVSPYINDLLGEVASWAPSAVFGVLAVASASLAMVLPETKDADLPEHQDDTNTGIENPGLQVDE